jgi:hypothetical protein
LPNPSGANQFAKQPAYGDVKKLMNLEKSAPLAGAPTTSIGAPKRAQRRAVKGQKSSGAQPAPMPQPTAPDPSYNAVLSQVFNELVAMQPDNPLFQYYAQKTQQ